MICLADVIEALTGIKPENASKEFTEVGIDSRQVIPGSLFIALPGERADGHDFIADVFDKGAYVALVQKDLSASFPSIDLRTPDISLKERTFDVPLCLLVEDCLSAMQKIAGFWRRKLPLRVVGITGSVGKSTTKEMTAEVLSRRFRTLKNPGNMNNEIGLPLTLLHLTEAHERAVLEMGFYVPGEISFLCELALPQIGVVTNIGTVHAERAGTQEDIARGKAELIHALPPAPEGIAILNYDDPLVRPMAELTKANIFYYGLDPEADLWADQVEGLGLEGIRFRLHYRNETLHLKVPLIGRHSVHTALRATAVGLVEGLTWQEIINGLRTEQTQLRLFTVRGLQGSLLLDDTYNASPESTLAALSLLEELEGNHIAVLGDMLELGIYERRGHEMVGVKAAEVVDELITVGQRARMIAESARKAGLDETVITELDDIDAVLAYLSPRLKENDVVLIKGSHGMQMDRIVAALEQRT